MSIPVMEAHSGAFWSIPVRTSPFMLLYAPAKNGELNVALSRQNFVCLHQVLEGARGHTFVIDGQIIKLTLTTTQHQKF